MLKMWVEITHRQAAKDDFFLSELEACLVPGTLLELGAGVGQLARKLQERGYDVVASDLEPFFVEHMKALGLKALVIDAIDVAAGTDRTFDNIYTQGVSPIVQKNLSRTLKTYESASRALRVGGRFIVIHGGAYDRRYNRIRDHYPLFAQAGFRLIRHFRHQMLPSAWYRHLNTFVYTMIEGGLGRHMGLRNVLVLEKT